MLSKKIIYTGAFRFPNGDAASQRVLNNAKILRELGYTVEFVSWGGAPREEDLRDDGLYYYQGFKYKNTNEIDNNKDLGIIGRTDSFFRRGRHSLGLITAKVKDTAIVIAYNPPAYFTNKLLSLYKKNDVLFISDITEWYSAKELPGRKYAPPYWISEYNMRVVQKRVANKILISSFLNAYFSTSNNIVLPPLVDSSDDKWSKHKEVLPRHAGLRLVYAGTPGMKDSLETMLEAVISCLNDGLQMQFVVIGASKEEIRAYSCYEEVISHLDSIRLLGRVPQQDIPSYYNASDFSVLVRENNRKNRAGFPTKLAESLMAGCPVIVNYTSDIADYVKNDYNGIVISYFTKNAVRKALEKAVTLDRKSKEQMKINAKTNAIEKFDYKSYKERMKDFVNKSRKG